MVHKFSGLAIDDRGARPSLSAMTPSLKSLIDISAKLNWAPALHPRERRLHQVGSGFNCDRLTLSCCSSCTSGGTTSAVILDTLLENVAHAFGTLHNAATLNCIL